MTPSPQSPTSRFRFLQQWAHLGVLLRYGWFFSMFLILLPLTAIDDVPLHGVLGGLFVDLTPWEIYFVSIVLLGLAWSLMFTEGLIVNSIGTSSDGGATYQKLDDDRPTGHVPAWAERFFSVPVTPPQFAFFSLLVVPGFFVIVQNAAAGVLSALLAVALGVVTAYGLLIVLSAPAAIVDPDDPPMVHLPLADPVWSTLTSIRPFVWAVDWLRRAVSAILRALDVTYMLGPSPSGHRVVHAPHFIAITNASGLMALIALIAVLFSPARPDGAPASGSWSSRILPSELPAVMYLYIIGILLVLVFTTLQFHLGRLRVSPVAALVVIAILGYGWSALDHDFTIARPRPPRPEDALTPVAVARGSGKNLVAVVASGGGILAAGWTTLALEKLVEARPELRREIRLLSTISGGSVGAAYFLDSTLRGEPPAAAKVKSTTSSLSATAYGFAFLDLPRLVSGGLVSSSRDRGILLEDEWLAIANGTVRGGTVEKRRGALTNRSLGSLRGPILAGAIPAPIFGATIMESGRRVMITPIDFRGQPDRRRGETLSEFLFEGEEADVNLWTAARLSATFAFVSPAARAKILAEWASTTPPRKHQAHHLIDGGYYDNFGVTSALDWLEPVLDAREKGETGLDFERVLVIQLRAFRRDDPKAVPARTGAIAALLGPFIGLEAIRDGAAVSRNDIELARFARAWRARLRRTRHPVDICLATLQPPQGPAGPLSWHLSAADRNRLEKSLITFEVTRVKGYLAGTDPCPEPVN